MHSGLVEKTADRVSEDVATLAVSPPVSGTGEGASESSCTESDMTRSRPSRLKAPTCTCLDLCRKRSSGS